MKTVGAYDAKTHLPQLIERVTQGERITITRHGVPVAMLVPPEGAPERSPAETIAQMREFRKNIHLRGLSIRKLIEEGRR
ncbi:MAG TPA: type II toxin-antitoxin system prevent-host-death family antitoxin [Candidatus Sumerlaeota bacterium]|nr:type II toxin-antitoxin system prevent-host-death family antitoxin [Candidatus Sumerlaeota bacterium]HPS01779.1 type II toxin-antitoxin system prevent-host-death family antitoxin [Candidatus Sumerlaeota bacterium]